MKGCNSKTVLLGCTPLVSCFKSYPSLLTHSTMEREHASLEASLEKAQEFRCRQGSLMALQKAVFDFITTPHSKMEE